MQPHSRWALSADGTSALPATGGLFQMPTTFWAKRRRAAVVSRHTLGLDNRSLPLASLLFRKHRALPKKSVYQSARRTNDSSPAVHCWEKELKDVLVREADG
jgi:hypothetical protein